MKILPKACLVAYFAWKDNTPCTEATFYIYFMMIITFILLIDNEGFVFGLTSPHVWNPT